MLPTRESDFLEPVEASRRLQIDEPCDGLQRSLKDICQMIESSGRGLSCSIHVREAGVPMADSIEEASVLTCPLHSALGELLGWISLRYPSGQLEAPGDRELLRSASHLAAGAIEQRMPVRHDSLTGLLNRAQFRHKASSTQAFALLSIDLDRFQPINHGFGRETGDRLLQEASKRLMKLLGSEDFAGRMDGVGFAVALAGEIDEPSALRKAEKFLEALRVPYHIDGVELFVTASIGLAVNGEKCTTEQLHREADQAMHVAKRAGGNTLEVFRPESHSRSIERLHLDNALHRAIENRELDLLFQPIVDMQSNLEGFEALLTWHHPVFGIVPPGVFIPIAEENGFIVELGSWVMRQACLRGASWLQAGRRGVHLSVNVSARQFDRDDLGTAVAETLAVTRFPPEFLELELTESCIVRDLARSARRMAAIRELGVRIAIDDFGTGYSSLSYLSKLPVDTLKLDQSFIRDIAEGASLPVIQGVVRLAHSLNLTVVAEGVETYDHLDLVRLAGCDRAQGNFHGPSLRASQVEDLLARVLTVSR